ncbi:hypothetical protein GOODEAATRI_014507 [Goodea atripinnis]|uniref:CH-like domain-containing protein n=1 Tax=Goodea atripinnis TaxID=208336 RepID=A0ABV0PNJ5_9TELE
MKWLQALELSFYPKNLRRDFSNGYLVAEIFSHYYPQDFSMYLYHKGVSFYAKQQNWSRIQQGYQELLPSLARSTALRAVKNNLTATKIMAQPDMSTNPRKAQIIVSRHLEHRAAERFLIPGGSFRGHQVVLSLLDKI